MVQKMIMARHIEVCRRLYNKDNRSIKLWILLGSGLMQYENSTLRRLAYGFADGNTHDVGTGTDPKC